MSWEEDFLMAKVRELEDRIAKLEEQWAGNSSSTSTEKQPTNTETRESESQKPAQTTESPSEKDQTENSSVSSTAGSTPEIGIGSKNVAESDLSDEVKRLLGE